MKKYPICRKDNLVVQEMDGEVLIYDLNDNKAFCLNATSALIWQACDGKKTTAEISDYVSKKLNTPANEDLIWLALDQLKKENLIVNGDELADNFAGMSRREVIKKVGLSTMIALPMVAGMVAPTAVSASSACSAIPCIPPNTDVCAGCAPGTVITGFEYTSANGSCSIGQAAASITCNGPQSFPFDTQRS